MDLVPQLRELAKLREEGALTQEQYDSAVQRVLEVDRAPGGQGDIAEPSSDVAARAAEAERTRGDPNAVQAWWRKTQANTRQYASAADAAGVARPVAGVLVAIAALLVRDSGYYVWRATRLLPGDQTISYLPESKVAVRAFAGVLAATALLAAVHSVRAGRRSPAMFPAAIVALMLSSLVTASSALHAAGGGRLSAGEWMSSVGAVVAATAALFLNQREMAVARAQAARVPRRVVALSWGWALAVAPIAVPALTTVVGAVVLEQAKLGFGWIDIAATLIAMPLLAMADRRGLATAGSPGDPPTAATVWMPPLYLVRRARATSNSMLLPAIWAIAALCFVVVAIVSHSGDATPYEATRPDATTRQWRTLIVTPGMLGSCETPLLHSGMPITVENGSGRIVGTGRVGRGKATTRNGVAACEYRSRLRVRNSAFYSVYVNGRHFSDDSREELEDQGLLR